MKNIPFFFLLTAVIAINEAEAQNALPIKKLSIFKNGTGMFIKEGVMPIKKGEVLLPIPTSALYGTYWIGCAKENSVKSIVFKNDTVKVKKEASNMFQLLTANVGKPLTIHTTPKTNLEKTYTGTLLSYDKLTSFVKMQIDKQITSINAEDIFQIDYAGDANKIYEDDSIARMLVLKPEKVADNVSLQEFYMQTGLNWIPSYFLKLKDDKTARLEMKATVENFAEDLKDAETELVVGSPQMYYGTLLDPMTYEYLSSSSIDNGISDFRSKTLMNMNAVQTLGYTSPASGGEFWAGEIATDGEKNDDMYIYKLGKISLQKDGKGNFPIFSVALDYKDKYEANLSDYVNYYANKSIDEADRPVDVFHSLEIKNMGSTPFTTAPIFVVNEKDQFMAQDQLKYTPAGATGSIKLSKAIDVILKNNEEESTRVDAAKKVGKIVYNKVLIKGSITVNNYQNKEINLCINKDVNGTVNASSDGALVTKKTNFSAVNPYSTIKWDVKLGANEKKTYSYEYEVFVQP